MSRAASGSGSGHTRSSSRTQPGPNTTPQPGPNTTPQPTTLITSHTMVAPTKRLKMPKLEDFKYYDEAFPREPPSKPENDKEKTIVAIHQILSGRKSDIAMEFLSKNKVPQPALRSLLIPVPSRPANSIRKLFACSTLAT